MPPSTPRHAPPWPDPFLTPVLGTVFAERAAVVHRLHAGDHLILVPDPPDTEDPNVWVHAPGGDLVGHLPVETGARLAQWMIAGGRAGATVDKVGGEDVASWRRLIVRVECHPD
ncbi:hypothetical protein tb265_32240 [Gemmatimonadetes bacterium T265]|nr:hypothetical protein tb265_32240 [Gemmatimonadetes bacterium T265]